MWLIDLKMTICTLSVTGENKYSIITGFVALSTLHISCLPTGMLFYNVNAVVPTQVHIYALAKNQCTFKDLMNGVAL